MGRSIPSPVTTWKKGALDVKNSGFRAPTITRSKRSRQVMSPGRKRSKE